jgi:hypothetical protein
MPERHTTAGGGDRVEARQRKKVPGGGAWGSSHTRCGLRPCKTAGGGQKTWEGAQRAPSLAVPSEAIMEAFIY